MSEQTQIRFEDGAAYETYMGLWSRKVGEQFLDWLGDQPAETPWFAHLSFLRPHPPYSAAGHFAEMYDPADVGMPIAPIDLDRRHPLHGAAMMASGAPTDEAALRHLRAQYFGMISEVDAQLGRIWQALQANGMWDDTLVVVTADHGEQLGDHGLLQKVGWFEESHHIIGIVRDPRHPRSAA